MGAPKTVSFRALETVATNLPGEGDADFISDTNVHYGSWYGFLATAAVSGCDLTGGSISGTVTSVPIPAGVFIAGRFSYIKLAGGSVVAYRNPTQSNAPTGTVPSTDPL
jgi:hypothetical protein